MAGASKATTVEAVREVIAEIMTLPECRGVPRRYGSELTSRISLLAPFFDDLLLHGHQIRGTEDAAAMEKLHGALVSARDSLLSLLNGSKIHQAMRSDEVFAEFRNVNDQIDVALSHLPYQTYNHISPEIIEQVELVHSQFRRARQRKLGSLDIDLRSSFSSEKLGDPSTLKRFAESLDLMTLDDIKKESVALHDMVIFSGGEPDENLEEMSHLLKTLNNLVANSDEAPLMRTAAVHDSPIIPDEFRCPLSLELMHDPVIVSTGVTYERSCIQKYLDSGFKTCPKTQQVLSHLALTPNFVLKSLIAQWCEASGVDLPKSKTNRPESVAGKTSDYNHATMVSLMHRLRSTSEDDRRAAAGEVRLLAKRNVNNRISIAEHGAIPLLVDLLSSLDHRTQEHAVTSLLNLSIYESNKKIIVEAHAIPKIVEVLENGSTEASENAAAALFSLSDVDLYRKSIGMEGAIPPLVDLLRRGSPRGRRDAAMSLFNLCRYPGNRVLALEAGIGEQLMKILDEPASGMVDEVLTILVILVGSPEGKSAISQLRAVPRMVEALETGSARNKENAAAILLLLCSGDDKSTATEAAGDLRVTQALTEIAKSGTDRAKRKANSLLALLGHGTEESS